MERSAVRRRGVIESAQLRHLRRRDAAKPAIPSSAIAPGAGTTENDAVLTSVEAVCSEPAKPAKRVKV
jgi:hypothetical protein